MCESVRGCIQGFAKVILIIVNTIAHLSGIGLIGLGIFTMLKGKEYLPDVGISLTTPAVCLIILGALLFIISCFGCFGAITGRLSLLNVYLVLLGIIIVLEIAVLIYGFVNKGKVESTIKDAITDPFTNVNEKGTSALSIDRATVDTIQEKAECCGMDGPDFWTNAQFASQVPASCCKDSADDEELCDKDKAYQEGCLNSTEGLVKNALTIIIIVIVVIVLFQLICMAMAWCSRGDYESVDA